MNILFIMGTYPDYGGVENVSTLLANAFAEKGHHIWIASYRQPHPELAAMLNDKIKLLSLCFPLWRIGNYKKLHALLKKQKIDVIINQWSLPVYHNYFLRLAMAGTTTKLINVCHSVPGYGNFMTKYRTSSAIFLKIIQKFRKLIIRINLNLSYRFADHYVLLSKHFIPVFQKMAFLPKCSKFSAIGNPVLNNEFPIQKEKQLLFVGRFDEQQKRISRIIEIWSQLEPIYPDWKLVLVGNGPDHLMIENLIQAHQLKNIELTGFQKPDEYYAKSPIFLMTSDYEGWGIVLLEAMAGRCIPVAYASYDSIYDIIENEKNGFIIPAFDENKYFLTLKNLMERFQTLPSYYDEMENTCKRYSVEKLIEKWLVLFHELTGDKKIISGV